jgi:hypothetical protein
MYFGALYAPKTNCHNCHTVTLPTVFFLKQKILASAQQENKKTCVAPIRVIRPQLTCDPRTGT